jgi:hypothetical protein
MISRQPYSRVTKNPAPVTVTKTLRHVFRGESPCLPLSHASPTQEARFFVRIFSDTLMPVYPGDRILDVSSHGDDWSDNMSSVSDRVEKVVDSINATASEMLSTDADIEDMWLAKEVLTRIAKARNISVDDLIEDVCDKLDELETTLFNPPFLSDSD